jgi:methylated-DNA-protein-cysteine methyltransferase-like protein
MPPKHSYSRIWDMVCKIPRGKVTTYSRVAELCHLHGQQRLVGYALHNLPLGSDIPWHRVINAKGMISLRGEGRNRQQLLLEREGIVFLGKKTDLQRFGWKPPSRAKHGKVSTRTQ